MKVKKRGREFDSPLYINGNAAAAGEDIGRMLWMDTGWGRKREKLVGESHPEKQGFLSPRRLGRRPRGDWDTDNSRSKRVMTAKSDDMTRLDDTDAGEADSSTSNDNNPSGTTIKVHLPPGYHHHRHDWYPHAMMSKPLQCPRDQDMGEAGAPRADPMCMAIVPYVGGSQPAPPPVINDRPDDDDGLDRHHLIDTMDVDPN